MNKFRTNNLKRITDFEQLLTEAYEEGYADGVKLASLPHACDVEVELTANEKRKALIDKAKYLLISLKEDMEAEKFHFFSHLDNLKIGRTLNVEFVVNKKKRTTVAIVRGVLSTRIYSKGIAKCMPDEVFNADIGRYIALCKALNVDVPDEFLYAVQPIETEIGMVVKTISAPERQVVGIQFVGGLSELWRDNGLFVHAIGSKITDDTNARYI